MKNRLIAEFGLAKSTATLIALLALPAAIWAQVPVDENGDLIGEAESLSVEPATGNEDIPLLSTVDLEELVGPIALYPDDLLAIVLPASAYPLQVVDAARFLEALEDDPSLEPDSDWDDSVVALTNYPEVIELLNDDIDWTWRLGEAVVSQQADVVAAIETFRDRAYAAGNLKSDSYQNVSRDEGVIEITPVAEDVIYVPYYEPERVVVYQPRPVYYYYPRPYPVYYYPYSSTHAFNRGYFWGVTTAFTIGWYSDSLNVFHHSYYGHPYYGRSYRDHWWYRRPTINIYNNYYGSGSTTVTVNRYSRGDRWHPRGNRREYLSDNRITRNRTYPVRRQSTTTGSVTSLRSDRSPTARTNSQRRPQNREPITFRERPQNTAVARGERAERAADRRTPATRTSRQRSETIARDRTNTDRTQLSSDNRRQEPRDRRSTANTRVIKERRTEPTPKLRRAEPVPRTRSSDSARQVRRTETTAATTRSTRRVEPVRQAPRNQSSEQTRRSAPASRSTRPAQTSSPVRRSQPAAAHNSAPTRPAVRQAPQRQQRVEQKSTPAKESRKAPERKSRRNR